MVAERLENREGEKDHRIAVQNAFSRRPISHCIYLGGILLGSTFGCYFPEKISSHGHENGRRDGNPVVPQLHAGMKTSYNSFHAPFFTTRDEFNTIWGALSTYMHSSFLLLTDIFLPFHRIWGKHFQAHGHIISTHVVSLDWCVPCMLFVLISCKCASFHISESYSLLSMEVSDGAMERTICRVIFPENQLQTARRNVAILHGQ